MRKKPSAAVRKYFATIGRRGGKARDVKLSPERRREIAAMGGRAKARR